MLSTPKDEKHAGGIYKKDLPYVFVIGHNKIATRSIDLMFKMSGYRALHWDKGSLAGTIKKNMQSNLPLLTHIDDYHCYSDMENVGSFYAYELFPLFDLQYPNSLFIYNHRPVSAWIESRKNHRKYLKVYRKKFNSRNNLKLSSKKKVEEHWRSFFERHEKRVFDYFKGKSNLIVVDIESSESQSNLLSRLSNAGFKIDDSLTSLPVAGVTKKS